MPRIPDDDLEGLKRNTNLAELVRLRGVELKKHGGRDLIGRCPLPGHKDKTPSFIVTPGKNLFHCFGCGAAGGPIDFIMKLDGLTFRAAVDTLLAQGPVRRASATPEAAKRKEVPALPEERAQVLMERVITIYAEAFADSPGRAYLEKRGLADLSLLAKYRVGYADGRLARLLPSTGNSRDELRALGMLLDERGRERFAGCVVFPVLDESGRIVTLYGRSVATATSASASAATSASALAEPGAEGRRHVYLPNRPQGLWNAAILKSSPHIVFVESVIDALSVITSGVGNVLSIQGTNGFGDDDAALLKAHGIQRVTLLLDGAAAGRAANERLKEKLSTFSCEAVAFPEGEDPNSYLVK